MCVCRLASLIFSNSGSPCSLSRWLVFFWQDVHCSASLPCYPLRNLGWVPQTPSVFLESHFESKSYSCLIWKCSLGFSGMTQGVNYWTGTVELWNFRHLDIFVRASSGTLSLNVGTWMNGSFDLKQIWERQLLKKSCCKRHPQSESWCIRQSKDLLALLWNWYTLICLLFYQRIWAF